MTDEVKALKEKLKEITLEMWDLDRQIPHDLVIRYWRLSKKKETIEKELEQVRQAEKILKEKGK